MEHIQFVIWLASCLLLPYSVIRKKNDMAAVMVVLFFMLLGPVIMSLSPSAKFAGEVPVVLNLIID